MAYAGTTVKIPLGQYGILSDISPNEMPPGTLIDAKNITLAEGRVQKAPGSRAYNDVALPGGVIAICDWWPSSVVQRMIAACDNGYLYRDNGTGSFAYNSGAALNATQYIGLNPNAQFIRAGEETAGRNRKLFFCSHGQNQLQVLDGDDGEFRAIANPAADWANGNFPMCAVLHKNSLWAFAGQTAYGSDTGDHENFVGGTLILTQVYPGEGGQIIGAFVFRGRLFCFKEDNYGYWLDDSDLDAENWVWKKLNSSFGLSGTNACLEALNDMLAGNSSGTVTSYEATNSLGDVDAGDIFKSMGVEAFLRDNTSDAGIEFQHGIYYSKKKLVFFTYRSAYYTHNNMLAVIDLNAPSPRFTYWRKGTPNCLALRRDSTRIKRPMYGSADGKIYIMDWENRREGAVAYEASFQTPHMDFGASAKNKLFDWSAVTYVPEGEWNLSCDYFIDGKYIDTIEFPMVQYERPVLGDDAADTGKLILDRDRTGQRNSETSIRELAGSGRTISFRFHNAGINQSFQVTNIEVGFRPSGEQAQDTQDAGE